MAAQASVLPGADTRSPARRAATLSRTRWTASGEKSITCSKGAARDLGPCNITVNVVQTGLTETDMAAASVGKLPPSLMEVHAIQRRARVQEVAAGILFLAGPSASFITGSVLDVNGGYLA